jgi:5-methyltetrahydropteroyltriglutamate--homocysteine methyltransferase
MNAASPGVISAFQSNHYYPTHDAYVDAVAAAMKPEYDAIAAAGFVLQLDCPDLAMARHTGFQELDEKEFLRRATHQVEALNDALRDIPADAMRMHICWGNYEGPHTHDVALDEILALLYEARVGALVLSMANARHAHEHACFTRQPLPAQMVLVAGVIDTTSNYVEHEEVVAERIERIATAVGDPQRVLAATDCGFDTSAGIGDVAPSVVWEKLRALRVGADRASERLF